MIEAPGHGKDIGDGLCAIIKEFLRKCFRMVGTPEADKFDERGKFNPATTLGDPKAGETAIFSKLCADKLREGFKPKVGGKEMNSKRIDNAKVKSYTFERYDEEDVTHRSTKKEVRWLTARGDGLMNQYNMRADPDLGIGYIALRRAPCVCAPCLEQLKKPWVPSEPKTQQPRYARNTECALWPVFEGANDWKVVQLVDAKGAGDAAEDDFDDGELVLATRTDAVCACIEEGKVGALDAKGDDDGYYLVQWTSAPYGAPEDMTLTDFTPPVQVKQGDMLIDGTYFNAVQGVRFWYTPAVDLTLTAPARFVVRADVEMHQPGPEVKLPKASKKVKKEMLAKGAVRVDATDHEKIMEELRRRDALDAGWS
mmetsp:Transcript_22912/g.76909  ORF Transcript_22912/g.76909 Transcript_22912/m.76909 type:complete len:368 (+) Transcript_22912:205-1308(+)